MPHGCLKVHTIDLITIATYFAFMLALGFLFRKQVTDVSEYFRGGGKMLWWMSGTSAFITTFSAWTFTGAAGKAYEDGFPVVIIFVANALSYILCARFLAARFRQLRVDSPLEAYKKRYGRINEQFNLWIYFVASLLPGGITLVAVSVFISAILGWDLQLTIVATGTAVLVITMTGGAWAVIASDYMQAMLIVAITLVAGWQAISIMGGIMPIIEQFPAENIVTGNGVNHSFIFVLWVLATLVQRLHDVNNLDASIRFIAAKDSQHSKKAALFAGCLFAFASLIWFLPPMVSAIKFPDLASMYPTLNNPSEAAYLAFVDNLMPVGMLGLLVAAMFAATMSSMDSALNGGAGRLIKCAYKPLLRPRASDRELLVAGRFATLVLGILQIYIAVVISRIEGVSLFNLMLGFLGLFGLPLIIPGIMSFLIRRTPDWSAWSTVAFGFFVSWLAIRFNGQWLADVLDWPLTAREASDMNLVITYAAHLTLTLGWFLLTLLFYKPLSAQRQQEVDSYYRDFDTPVVSPEGVDDNDNMQRRRLGMMTVAFGALTCLLVLAGSEAGRVWVFLGCGGFLLAVGGLLVYFSRTRTTVSGLEAQGSGDL